MVDPNTYIHTFDKEGHLVQAICGITPRQNTRLPIRTILDMGFGAIIVKCDGATVYSSVRPGNRTMRWVETRARKKPGADWQVIFYGPMVCTTYQRRGKSRWYLIKSENGFA